MALTREAFFETLYANAGPEAQLVIQLKPQVGKGASNYHTSVLRPSVSDADATNENMNIFFSAIPRKGGSEEAGLAPLVWLDVDGDALPYDDLLAQLHLEPTAIVNSGHGWHVYWALQTPIEPEHATALGRLLALTFRQDGTYGDSSIYDTRRNMRVPFSWNAKTGKPKSYCELRLLSERFYSIEELEDGIIATALVPFWAPGQRNNLAEGLGALLARADYDVGRAAKLAGRLIAWAGQDDDDLDKTVRVLGKAIYRKQEGKANSAKNLLEIVGDTVYHGLITALGIDSNNGAITLDGQKVGHIGAGERDVANYIVGQGQWASMEGEALFHWNGKFWEAKGVKAMRGDIIETLEATKVLKDGIEQPFVYSNKFVVDTASLVEARLIAQGEHQSPTTYLFFPNGVLDLATGATMPHSPENWNRWALDFDYRPEADCPVWLDFLAFATESPAVIDFLQEWVGYCLTIGNPWQKMLWLHGLSNTGKSTFIKVLQSLLGPAQVSIDPHALGEYEVARLEGALLATCSEVDLGVLRTDRLKALISGDTVNARHPYGRPFSAAFNGKFVWGSNGLPPSSESDGWYRRLDVVLFEHRPENPDMFLHQKLYAERAGILNWAIEGWKRQQQYRLDKAWPVPTEVSRETQQYEEEGDTFARFVGDSFSFDDGAWESAATLYVAYRNWAQTNGHRPLPHGSKFGRELQRFGLTRTGLTSKNGIKTRGWKGARLRTGKVLAAPMSEAEADKAVEEAYAIN